MNENKSNFTNFSKLKFVLIITILVVVWAFAFLFIKIGLEELSFVNLTIMRFLIVCLVLILILFFQKKRFSKLHKKDIVPLFLLGFFGVIVYHLGLNYGEQFISPAAASLIIATVPVQIIILSTIFLKEKIGLKKLIGIIIALCGVVVISIWGKAGASIHIEYISAVLAVLIAAIMSALYTIAGKKLLTRYSALSLTTYVMLLGSLGLTPFIRGSLLDQISKMSMTGWFAVIFLGVFSTVVGYGLWYIVLKIKSASEISIYLYAIPVLSTIISYFMFKEKITLMFILGGFLVIAGLIIVNIRTKINFK
ncbi:MAG: DMT family transporter [Actinomycetia bacterium]|nr:DMT family transporter [Actinomycetes bacterium]